MRAKTSSQSMTRPNNATPYAINDVVGTDVATNLIFSNVYGETGSEIIINRVELRIDVNTAPAGMGTFKLHLYNAAPTPITDNLAFNIIAADREKYLGYILIDAPLDFGDTLYSNVTTVDFQTRLADNSNKLYGVLTTDAVFTPSAVTVKTIRLHSLGV